MSDKIAADGKLLLEILAQVENPLEEVAYKAQNIPDRFQQAFNILSKNNATISSRYHGEAYVYAYWLYGADKIYRQKMKRA